ncbi:zinc-binding metallopeptidase family protein [Granulosicoccus antarcticus]|uniref:Zinc-ribbon domain-containing protein n=1 Tax=Granulosicoccus antarcticus IMCC3135 TaxID=1192854 RepID=A0A2Z2NN09_9GAMM|nr:putative zinc-binding metallopeptidase [Granulosicoccus antarcticus]ASJ71895.1 hypothetical protein IMCC3135_08990 [Granulosicoccus antarcticus IMCC3135]
MELLSCPQCAQVVYFDNDVCLSCNTRLAFDPGPLAMVKADVDAVMCKNASNHSVCNWTALPDSSFCLACNANKTIPDLSAHGNLSRWRAMEQAKRRLYYSLRELGLVEVSAQPFPERAPPLRFQFLGATANRPVTTGHEDGLITIDIAEAEDAERERRRDALGEDYRTPLGHLRHETGHYFWLLLVDSVNQHDGFRAIFGDERQDYSKALKHHYEKGPRADRQDCYITAYASAHPHEDWAETFAHYLHIYDTMMTAQEIGFIPLVELDGQTLVEMWIPLSVRLNLLNRSMGVRDLYPFVLTKPVRDKLIYVHEAIQRSR